MPSLWVILPGFGERHWDEKVQFLRHNISVLQKQNVWDLRMTICQYTIDRDLPNDITQLPWVHIQKEKGILFENICKHCAPSNPTDFVMILLDDVILHDDTTDWNFLLHLQKQFHLDILSPSLQNRSMSFWEFMTYQHDPRLVARCVTRCELFCYLMTFPAYCKYFEFADPLNPWGWGMDFLLYTHMQLKSALVNPWIMSHMYPRPKDDTDLKARKDSEVYLEKHNTNWHERNQIPCVLTNLHVA